MPEVTDETVAKGGGWQGLGELEVALVDELVAGLVDIGNLIAEVIRGDTVLQEFAEALIVLVGLNKFDGWLTLLAKEGDVTAMGREIYDRLCGIAKGLKGRGGVLYGVGDVTEVI